MKPSNELFDLIQSLTKSEKRFFKLHSSLQSGDKNYLRLFDAIDRMKEYDETSLKKLFKGEKFIRHLPSEKNHLYRLILKALRAYHGENSISSILKQEIKNIEILYTKALFEECNKFLIRAKKLAVHHEKFYYLFELINWEKMLLEEAFEDGQFTRDLDGLIAEEKEVIDKLRNLAEYHVLYSKINYVFRSGGYVRTEENKAIVDEIVNHPLIKDKNTALSKRAATICYYTQGFCNMANGEQAVALEKFKKVKEILDGVPHLKDDLAKRYVRTLSNIVNCNIDLGEYKEAEKVIAEMRQLPEQQAFSNADITVSIFKNTGLAQLYISQRTNDYIRGVSDAEELMKSLSDFEGNMHKEHELTFYYQFAYIYFLAGQFNKALYWINKLLNDNENSLRQDVYSYVRLFNLVVHYELGNLDLLEYTLKSTTRYLQRRGRDYPIEKVVLENMRKLIRAQNDETRRKIFLQFRDEMQGSIKGPEDQAVLKYFDFFQWIDQKLDSKLVPSMA
ncbi:MAG: hypothetical protein SGI87_03660 [Flavobacteriales bacterium]|nr:hypothetical protein [Flavobacteriales bacterium]